MLLKQMQYFVMVVKYNSFTEAAEELFVSQSAISQQIMSLEADLGVKLLIREKRKFNLTKAGEYFYRQSLIILDEVERVKRETERIAQENQSAIRIGYLRTCGVKKLTYALSLFTEMNPNTEIHIYKGNHEELYEMLKKDQIDIAINDQRRAFSDEFVNFNIMPAYIFVEVNKKNNLSMLNEISTEDLKRIPCIIIASKEQEEIEKEYYKSILNLGEDFILAENKEEARLLVAGNRGYFLSESISPKVKEDHFIKQIPLYRHGQQITKQYCAFWKKNNHSEQLESFAKLVYNQFNEKKYYI